MTEPARAGPCVAVISINPDLESCYKEAVLNRKLKELSDDAYGQGFVFRLISVTLDSGQAVIAYELQKDPLWNPPM